MDAPRKQVPFVGKTVGGQCDGCNVGMGVPVNSNAVVVGKPVEDASVQFK